MTDSKQPVPQLERRLLTVTQVAAFLNVSEQLS